MTDQTRLSETARPLAQHLRKQSDKWLETIEKVLSSQKEIGKELKLSHKDAIPPVTAFQMVHVSSIMGRNKYMQETQINEFSGVLAETLYGIPDEKLVGFLRQYEKNKELKLSEQLVRFSEDVVVALTGSAAGMVYGTPLAIMAKEFYLRNMGLVAEHFGDKKTTDACIKAIKDIHSASPNS